MQILVFIDYYLPGFRAGGPLRTIENLVDHFGDDYELYIVCRDSDFKVNESYTNVEINSWNVVGKSKVYYISRNSLTLFSIAQIIRETPHDILYLNSFFSFYFTTLPLLSRKLGLAPSAPCLIAPRGEFSEGALMLKKFKKNIFRWLASAIGLYRDVFWQASSRFEEDDILRLFPASKADVIIAPDLLPKKIVDYGRDIPLRNHSLRIVFISRIAPMKNLEFLLNVLTHVQTNVELAIFGPKEDVSYWNKCSDLIKRLPSNIIITVGEAIPNDLIREVFLDYDLFAFPTLGENFGHVIFESLSVGTPVIVSDQTSWQMDSNGALTVCPLVEARWVDEITKWSTMSSEELGSRRRGALDYARSYTENGISLKQNQDMFQLLFKSHHAPCVE